MGAVKFVNFQMLTRNGKQWAWVYARQGHSVRIASLAGVLFVATQTSHRPSLCAVLVCCSVFNTD